MTRPTDKRPPARRTWAPREPALKPFSQWLPANHSFYLAFRQWLSAGNYRTTAIDKYGLAARLTLAYLDKPYWMIDPEADLARVAAYVAERPLRPPTREWYERGLRKFAEFIRLRCHHPAPEKQPNWALYLQGLPDWMANDLRQFITHCRRNWRADRQCSGTNDVLRFTSPALRWIHRQAPLNRLEDLTPQRWYAYADMRLAQGIQARTLNEELRYVQAWLSFLAEEEDRPICRRFLLIDRLEEAHRLPNDVPIPQLRQLLQAIEAEAASVYAGWRRCGLMDQAWVLLMLHSGLRTGEVRRLKLSDIEWDNRGLRIEQSKGLKDRWVPLSTPVLQALKAYLEVRGPADDLPEEVFTFHHRPLTRPYCWSRLSTYSRRCGVTVHPHQLRHSCATLLLNAGAPILTVQAILGHRRLSTTLGYARLYDGTIAADYYRAMAQVEHHLALAEAEAPHPPTYGELVALVDALHAGTLNEAQAQTVSALRLGLTVRAEKEAKDRGGPRS